MKKIFKSLLLTSSILLTCSCALPFQSSKYPAWTTKTVLEGYTLVDGRHVDGWYGANIGQEVEAKWYKFTVNKVEFLDEYEGRKANSGKKLVHASITITNTADKDVFLFSEDFALAWDLEKEDRSYTTSLEAYTEAMLKNEMPIKQGETKTIDTVYEIDKNTKKPMAIYYYEQYSDKTNGNKYYVYIK